ncbi:MAG: MarR family winged helix-turn-helix transcriptional regulator [Thermodesulfobacteriota bacterium]
MDNLIKKGNQDGSPIDSASIMECRECTCFNLRKATRVVTQMFDHAMRPIGLRATQFTLLALSLAHGPVTVTKLADEIVADRTTLSRNLNPMEKSGLIKIEEGYDRRTRIVVLTKFGRNKLIEAYPIWKKTQEEIKVAMGMEKWSMLLSNVSDLVSKIRI